MKKQGKVTDYKLMFQLIDDKVPYPRIAEVFGVTAGTIAYHAAKVGHSRTLVCKDKEIIADYMLRMPIKKIQYRNACSHDAIYRALKRNGITPHKVAA